MFELKKNNKIFIGFGEITGYYQLLAKGFKEKGFDVTLVHENVSLYCPSYFTTKNDNFLVSTVLFARKKYFYSNNLLSKSFWFLLTEMGKFLMMFWAIYKFDVFIFGFGKSFILGNYDLQILKFFKKVIISNIGAGSESRPPYIDGSYYSNDGKLKNFFLIKFLTKLKRKKVQRVEKFSSKVISNPNVCHFNNKQFINWLSLGIPTPTDRLSTVVKREKNKPIKILHAPSIRHVKGSSIIKKAINNLKEKGYDILYIKINQLSHSRVLEELKKCDLVIDQCFSDYQMPGFATEAASMGKPVIIGGYQLDYFKRFYIDEPPPTFTCKPNEIEFAIEQLINNDDKRVETAKDLKKYVINYFSYLDITESYIRIINNKIPKTWYIDPKNIFYTYGWGVEKENLKKSLKKLLNKYGPNIFELSHNKKLEQFFIDFIKNKKI